MKFCVISKIIARLILENKSLEYVQLGQVNISTIQSLNLVVYTCIYLMQLRVHVLLFIINNVSSCHLNELIDMQNHNNVSVKTNI